MALTRNKNNPNQISNIKFNGGKFVDHPMITEIEVGAVAPWISIIPIQPHISEIFLLIIIKSFLIILWFYHTFSHLSTTNFGEVGENRTLVNGFADQFLTTRTLPQKFLWILIAFIDCTTQLSFYPPCSVPDRHRGRPQHYITPTFRNFTVNHPNLNAALSAIPQRIFAT